MPGRKLNMSNSPFRRCFGTSAAANFHKKKGAPTGNSQLLFGDLWGCLLSFGWYIYKILPDQYTPLQIKNLNEFLKILFRLFLSIFFNFSPSSFLELFIDI